MLSIIWNRNPDSSPNVEFGTVKSEVLIIIVWYGTRTYDHGVRLVHRTICLHHQHLAMEILTIVLLYDFEGCYTTPVTVYDRHCFQASQAGTSIAEQFWTNNSIEETQSSGVVSRGEEGTQRRSTRARGTFTRSASRYSRLLLFS